MIGGLVLGVCVAGLWWVSPLFESLGFFLLSVFVFLLASYYYAVEEPLLLKHKVRDLVSKGASSVTKHNISLFVGSWNVGDAKPPDSLADWIPPEKYDIYVVGSQECKFFTKSTSCADEWVAVLSEAVGSGYKLVASSHVRDAIRLVVLVRESLESQISNIEVASTLTQLPFFWRKGANGIAFNLYDTSFCFVNAHLSAHQKHVAMRNLDVKLISQKLFRSPTQPQSPSLNGRAPIPQSVEFSNRFENVFFFGDLNYRIDLSKEQTTTLAISSKLPQLEEKDQLVVQRAKNNVLSGFSEIPLTFPPTYKYKKNKEGKPSPNRTYADGRAPAWCDRVLYKSVSNKLSLIESGAPTTIQTSDHSPIYSVFNAEVKSYSQDNADVASYAIQFSDLSVQLNSKSETFASWIGFSPSFADLWNSGFYTTSLYQGVEVPQWKGEIVTIGSPPMTKEVLSNQHIILVFYNQNTLAGDIIEGECALELSGAKSDTPNVTFGVPLFKNTIQVGRVTGCFSINQL